MVLDQIDQRPDSIYPAAPSVPNKLGVQIQRFLAPLSTCASERSSVGASEQCAMNGLCAPNAQLLQRNGRFSIQM